MDHVGEKLKRLRKERRLTLRELGEKIKIDYAHISRIESGKKKPTLELVESFAEFYDVPVSYLFGEEQPLPKELSEQEVEWLVFGEEMEKRNLTPEELKKMVEFLRNFPK
jgi:transcriptional regulator with XRE-family HTH domain